MRQLDPKAFWLFSLRYFFILLCGLFFGAIFLLTTTIEVFLVSSSRSSLVSGKIMEFGMMLTIIALLISFIWAKLAYKNYRFGLTPKTIRIEQGVIYKKYVEIPYNRIQNIDIYQGLLARLLGLAVLQIQTAGYSQSRSLSSMYFNPEGRLLGISSQNAKKLRDELVQRATSVRNPDPY